MANLRDEKISEVISAMRHLQIENIDAVVKAANAEVVKMLTTTDCTICQRELARHDTVVELLPPLHGGEGCECGTYGNLMHLSCMYRWMRNKDPEDRRLKHLLCSKSFEMTRDVKRQYRHVYGLMAVMDAHDVAQDADAQDDVAQKKSKKPLMINCPDCAIVCMGRVAYARHVENMECAERSYPCPFREKGCKFSGKPREHLPHMAFGCEASGLLRSKRR